MPDMILFRESGVIRPFLQTLSISFSPPRIICPTSFLVPSLSSPPRYVAYLEQVTCQRNGASLAAPGITVRQVRPRVDWPIDVKPAADWPTARLRWHVGLISFTVGALAFSLSYLGRSVGRSVGRTIPSAHVTKLKPDVSVPRGPEICPFVIVAATAVVAVRKSVAS